jgi:hypothetical protein
MDAVASTAEHRSIGTTTVKTGRALATRRATTSTLKALLVDSAALKKEGNPARRIAGAAGGREAAWLSQGSTSVATANGS